MPGSASPRPEGVSGSLRELVLAGPGAGVTVPVQVGWNPLAVMVTPAGVGAALAAAGHADKCRAVLTGAVTTVLVVGLCLYCGEGYAGVTGRLRPLLGSFNPAVVMSAPVTAVALSQARARLPARVLRALFEAGAAATVMTAGSLAFGLVVTAVDGTVFDLAFTDAIARRFAIPSGGRFPQARVVTLVACGTRRVLAAQVGPCGVSGQRLRDRLVSSLQPGTLNLADQLGLRARRTTSGRMGATIYAVPTLVIIMSWLILGQVPRWLACVPACEPLNRMEVSTSRAAHATALCSQ